MKRLTGVLIAFLLTGCIIPRVWVYGLGASPVKNPIMADKKLVVPPFTDGRKNDNRDYWGLAMVPIMPFGWQTLEKPEKVDPHLTSRTSPITARSLARPGFF